MTKNIENMIVEIASFFNDPQAAIEILKKNKIADRGVGYLQHMLDREKKFFLQRLRYGGGNLPSVEILESRLDEGGPISHMCGHSLRFPAYEAELYYQGSMRFWYE